MRNNIQIDYDSEKDSIFSLYRNGGQDHDAGYDAFMTGYSFIHLAKYIEIGKII